MDIFFFLLPYVLSFAISLGVLFYTWRFRNVRGARAYAWYVAGQCLWILGYIFELINPSLDGKIFWDQIQWGAGLFITIAFPVFAIQYTETKVRQPRLIFGLSFVAPLLFLGILFTDSQHHLLYPNPYLDHTHIFSDLKYNFTWVVYAYAIYSYLVTFTGLGILIRRLIRPHRLYRRQISTVAIGFFAPILFTMLTVAGMEFIPFRDVTPFSFAFGNLVVAWGLFRYHLFDIIPIARDIVVENMEDLVVVLDMQDRVVDINSAALEALQMDSLQVLGQPAATIFAPWPELVEKFFEPENINTEISLSESDEINPFEIKSTILRDKKNRFTGRVFVARDVTERVNLQIKLEKLNYELEERVRERTKELQGSEERLRAIVDSAPFGAHLYQLEADERLVFIGANHSADDILQVDHQQFIGKTIEEAFPPLAETDIPAAYRAVATSGERFEMDQVDYEDAGIRGAFEIHAFQTGENRMAVFFRDITERKRAEEALIESEERFSTLAAASFEGIVISDKGRVIDCNEQLATILGYEQSEIVGLEVNKFVAPESLGIVLEHIKSGSEEPYEHLSLRKDGTKFPVEIRAKSIPFKGRQVRVTAIWDITERKKAEHDLLEAYDTTLKGWAKALELRDKETQDHSQRVTELTVTLARAMGVAEKDLIHFRRGAILHDIGKMGIPDEILRKRGPLTETEKSVVRQHPIHGYELLSPIPYLDKALDIPYCHHERWDGTGYPRGLKGEEIPLAARVFTVIDVWDALLSERPYSKAWSKKDTIQYLKDESGKIFDPECISLFLELVEQGKI